MDVELRPGPEDLSLLTLQGEHRSEVVWNNPESSKLRVKSSSATLFEPVNLDARVLQLFRQVGFYGVYLTGRIRLDHSLLTSLVERWRQETHSFHLPVGEATVTLQDIAVLWGMPIDGLPVTGVDYVSRLTFQQRQQLCLQSLGFLPNENDFAKDQLRFTCITNHLSHTVLAADCDVPTLHRYTRCKLLQLIGFVFYDKSGVGVNLRYLIMISDLEQASTYSWGSAVLATLYKELCHAAQKTTSSIAGPLLLLQLWAWERLPGFRPVLTPLHMPPIDGPRGCFWHPERDFEHVASHTLKIFRDQLDYLMDWQFVWEPYSDDMIGNLPDYCRRDRDLWCIACPLINFDVVEVHIPQRVMRQYGYFQEVPPACDTERSLHDRGRTGKKGRDWSVERAQYIMQWNDRTNRRIHGQSYHGAMHYNSEYMLWYRPRTRLLIGNPAHRPVTGVRPVASLTEFAARQFHHMHDVVIQAMGTLQLQDPRVLATFEELRDYTSNSLRFMGEQRRIEQPSSTNEEQYEEGFQDDEDGNESSYDEEYHRVTRRRH